jgi:hypothetical protein
VQLRRYEIVHDSDPDAEARVFVCGCGAFDQFILLENGEVLCAACDCINDKLAVAVKEHEHLPGQSH